jgi:hypothetical protein
VGDRAASGGLERPCGVAVRRGPNRLDPSRRGSVGPPQAGEGKHEHEHEHERAHEHEGSCGRRGMGPTASRRPDLDIERGDELGMGEQVHGDDLSVRDGDVEDDAHLAAGRPRDRGEAVEPSGLGECTMRNLGTQAERGGVLEGLGLHVLAGSGATFDTCVDPQTDPLDCGGCGVVCPAPASCVAGDCVGAGDGGGPITDGALADRVIGDVTPFLGTWSEEGTTVTTCPGSQPADGTSSGVGTLTAGTAPGTIVATETDDGAPPCHIVFDVSGSTATIEPNQACSNAFATVAYGTVTLTLAGPTTIKRSGAETESGQVNGVRKTCDVTETSTLTKL